MGVKYFCDKCGKEFDSKGLIVPMCVYDALGIKLVLEKYNLLCDECAEKFNAIKDRLKHEEDFFDMTDNDISLMEFDFKVGDKVITSTGQVGIIESICDCDSCKERGFYEPKVKITDGAGTIWITDNDKRVGFQSFYMIGKYCFGNIDKESVTYDIENENRKIKEAAENLEKYEKQLMRLKKLEFCKEEDEEENSSEEDSWLDWLL